jgi:hypothetical protein
MEEYQAEVFIYTNDEERTLIVTDGNNNIFRLEPHDCLGVATAKKKESMESIGIFNVY